MLRRDRDGLSLQSNLSSLCIIASRSIGSGRRVPIERFRPIANLSVFLNVGGVQISQYKVANQRNGNRSGEQEDLCEATQWAEYRNNSCNSGYGFEDYYKNPPCWTNSV